MINTNRIKIASKIAELTRECMLLNDDDFTVFVTAYSHIDSFEIRAFSGGWKELSTPSISKSYNFNHLNPQQIASELKQVKADYLANKGEVEKQAKGAKRKRLLAQLKELDNE